LNTDLWSINSQISNINKICLIVQVLAKRIYIYIYIYTHTHTHTHTMELQKKKTLSYSGGLKTVYYVYEKVNELSSRDRETYNSTKISTFFFFAIMSSLQNVLRKRNYKKLYYEYYLTLRFMVNVIAACFRHAGKSVLSGPTNSLS
jgi:hypothetical protein